MVDLSKLFDNLVAVSQGDVNRLSSATKQFTHDITQMGRLASSPQGASVSAAEPLSSAAKSPISDQT